MNGQAEALLPVNNSIDTSVNYYEVDDGDLGPSVSQTLIRDTPKEEADYELSGSVVNPNSYIANSNDISILNKITEVTTGKNKDIVIDWPSFSDKPVSEYGTQKVFCMLFPWLYPGGYGDYLEDRNIKISPGE